MKTFLIAAATEFLAFFLVVVNTRAYTQGLYGWTLATDAFFITQSFWVSKWMTENVEARGWIAYLGFLIGGVCGSLAAIFVTKLLYGA